MLSNLPKFKYNIGEIFCDDKRNLKIIDRCYKQKDRYKGNKHYISNQKFYKYKCLKCGNEDWLIEYVVDGKQKTGCNACGASPKKLVYGINDITTTAPWMVPYFIGGFDEAKKHFKYEKTKIDMICPDCGQIHKNKMIESVCNNKNLTCHCQDGWSYPNKYMYAFFKQIGVSFVAEKIFEWSNKYRYDIYIQHNGLDIVCEQNGIQHYEELKYFNFKRSLNEEQENDRNKQEVAIENGIDHYIVIDCRKSESDYIKNSVMGSNLDKILGFSYEDIDWDECDKFALSNLVKHVCGYKTQHSELTLYEIALVFHLSYSTILNYVKHGSKYGWCTYSIEESIQKRKAKYVNKNFKPVYCKTTGNYYANAKEAEKDMTQKFNTTFFVQGIQKSARTNKPYKNMMFEYVTA